MKYRNGKRRLLSVVGAMAAVAALFGAGPASSQGAPGLTAENPIGVNCATETTKNVDVYSERDVHFRIFGCLCRASERRMNPTTMTRRGFFEIVMDDLRDNGLSTLPVDFGGRSMNKADFEVEQKISQDDWRDAYQGNTPYLPNLTRTVTSAPTINDPRTTISHCYTGPELAGLHGDYKAYALAVVALIEFLEQNP